MLNPRLTLLTLIGLLLSTTTALAVQPSQGGGTGGSNCAPTFVVGSITGVVSAGQIDTCTYYSIEEHTAAGISQFTWISTGPAATGGLATYTVSFIGMTGCTATSVATDTSITAAGTMASGSATITLTTRDCRGYFQLELAVGSGAISIYLVRFAINIHVSDNFLLNYNCNAPETTPETFDPATYSCDQLTTTSTLDGNIGVDILNDATDDDQLTIPASMVEMGNLTIPATLEVQTSNPDALLATLALAWIVGLFISLRLAKLVAAGACTAGVGLTLLAMVAGISWIWQLIPLGLLALSLWLEALIPERIYQRFFQGESGTTRRA